MSDWYLARAGIKYGPYTWEQLQKIVEEGGIRRSDLFWSAELGQWTAPDKVPGLHAVFASEKAAASRRPVEQPAKMEPVVKTKRKTRRPLVIAACLTGVLSIVLVSGLLLFRSNADKPVIPALTAHQAASMSADQKLLFSLFGTPDHFTVLCGSDLETGKAVRMETWAYQPLQYYFTFENGVYMGGGRTVMEKVKEDRFSCAPANFDAQVTPVEVEKLIGEKAAVTLNEETGYRVLSFGDGVLYFTFNDRDMLVNILRKPHAKEVL